MTLASRRQLLATAGIGAAMVLVGSGCSDGEPTAATGGSDSPTARLLEGVQAEVRLEPGCGCCSAWLEHMRKSGATVDAIDDPDRAAFRRAAGITDEAASCHTAKIDGYVIEGHVPAEAVARLLETRPTGVGLALPGMPADAPGMGGDQAAWASQPVMLVGKDGSLSPWRF